MNTYRYGYLVAYRKKEHFFSDESETGELICSQGKLIELLQNPLWTGRRANWINVGEYQVNNSENKLREWGF
ncbi:hypothetical protein OBO34_11060 [Clostridiales Family XIII bacterium ASD5510]|uniref:Uncharacterized protein n=1 Tax=Hominibacterium faecale TaxID=2839743 RepID=A0A9J6QW61_9FIRM|nr:hypothetical protein [Hominibacterium faecale]MCU7378894.1 hypothetical protein [Hominibacterium faecale]